MLAKLRSPVSWSAALAAVAIVTCGVLTFSLNPDVGFWDTGEMQVVPVLPGLAHPTGYPTEILLGWAFVHALPFGEPALRMNLLCMLCVVVAALCCCAVALVLRSHPAIAAAAALCFTFTPVVWAHSTHADVTDPALALCALTILFAVLAVERDMPRFIVLAGLASGLALGTHGVVIWFLPAAAVYVVASGNRRLIRTLPLGIGIAAVAAAAVYAYLPLRSSMLTAARADPTLGLGLPSGQAFWDWGHPASWANFKLVVTGAQVAAPSSIGAIAHVERYGKFAAFGAAQLRADYPLAVLAALLLLAVWGALRSPRPALALLLPVALVTPFAASFSNESDVARYFTFPLLCLWALAAAGLSRVDGLRIPLVSTIAPAVLAGLAVYEVVAGHALFEERHNHLGSTFIASVLAKTDANAIVVAPWVYVTPLGYAAYVRHSTATRTIVSLYPEQARPYVRGWLQARPVYVISEDPPKVDVPAQLLGRLHVNDDQRHDPKLYRLRPPPGR